VSSPWLVVLGTTLGMLISDVPQDKTSLSSDFRVEKPKYGQNMPLAVMFIAYVAIKNIALGFLRACLQCCQVLCYFELPVK
jgi:hypothetical protein